MTKYLSAMIIVSAATLMSSNAQAERLVSVGFLSSNYQSCTGTCDKENIDSNKEPKEPGSLQWCERNCINRGKVDEYQFIQGVRSVRMNDKQES